MKKDILSILMLFVLLAACNKEYTLEWKIPNQGLYYETQMEDLESKKAGIKVKNSVLDTTKMGEMLDLMYSGVKYLKHYSLLHKDSDSLIDLKMITYLPKINRPIDSTLIGLVFSNMMQGISLNTRINKYGTITESYLQQKQKNLVVLLFGLPNIPVSVGDEWKLDIQLIEIGAGIDIIKSKEENLVRLDEIKEKNNSKVACISYNISSSIEFKNSLFNIDQKSGMEFKFKGKGEFDILNGKWIVLEGIITSKDSGIINTETVQKIKLIETAKVPKEVDNIAQGKPVEPNMELYNQVLEMIDSSETKTKIKTQEKIESKDDNQKKSIPVKETNINNECPAIYAVQIAASKNRISLNSPQFENLGYKVYEIIVPHEAYKYKYRVGKACSINEIQKIMKDLNKQGFSKTFIVKETKP